MKKTLFLILISLLPLIGHSQYIDVGYRASKFNQGVTIKTLFNLYKVNNPCGLEFFAGYSYIAKDGYVTSLSFVKQWGIQDNYRSDDIFIITQIGVGYGLFKDYYRIINGKKVDYPNHITPNLNINTHIGFEWISSERPLSFSLTCNPWYDFLNQGPEILDLNFTIKFQFKEY